MAMETRRPGPVTSRQQIDDPPQQWAELSHELNQPLTALMLYLRAAERVLLADAAADAARSILQKAIHEADRAQMIARRRGTLSNSADE
jgi:two-component system sensor kinase FixL